MYRYKMIDQTFVMVPTPWRLSRIQQRSPGGHLCDQSGVDARMRRLIGAGADFATPSTDAL